MKRHYERRYLPEFVYGGIDGVVTTFAVVSGAMGAGLSSVVVLILGFANLFADGFSMAVSNYLSTKSQKELHRKHSHRLNYRKGATPVKTGFATFVSFVLAGLIPLLPFVFYTLLESERNRFVISSILAGITFFVIGSVKGKVVEKNYLKSGFETFIIGGIASALAFGIGYLLKGLVG